MTLDDCTNVQKLGPYTTPNERYIHTSKCVKYKPTFVIPKNPLLLSSPSRYRTRVTHFPTLLPSI